MGKQNVLFLCTGNSARSQMAEGLLRAVAGENLNVYSAGLEPKEVHPLAVRAMDEIGIDIRGQRSKDVHEYLGYLPVHHLVTVCDDAAQRCPTTWPGVENRVKWSVDDPARFVGTESEQIAEFRRVREDLRQRILGWLATEPLSPRGALRAAK